MTPRIVFVRHGEAEHNVAAAGPEGQAAYSDPRWRDAPLTERGHAQAKATGEALSAILGRHCILWTSPLQRAIQTAMQISFQCEPSEFHASDALLERLGGGHCCNERAPASVVRETWDTLDCTGLYEAVPIWSNQSREPISAVRSRMQRFLLETRLRYSDSWRPIIVVSHHDAIHALTGMSLRNGEWCEV